jgi:LysR family glycine cleavage system transcriptional activator
VADCSSFTEAARQLHLTQSAISRQIQQLEEHYGVALFDRTSRKVALTDQGRDVYAVASESMAALRALAQRLSPPPMDRPFRIRIRLAGRALAAAAVEQFLCAQPGAELVHRDRQRRGGGHQRRLRCLCAVPARGLDERPLTLLFDEYLLPVCAPVLGDGQPPPGSCKRWKAMH